MELSILENISEEHELLYDEMRLVLKADGDLRKEIFDHIKVGLVTHIDAVKEAVYEKIGKEFHTSSVEDLLNRSATQHHELKEYLQRLTLMEISSPEWDQVFREFMDKAVRHCIEEEMELFQELKEDYGREELVEMGWDFINIRAAHRNDPDYHSTYV